jgi:hypothetical protein
MENRTDLRGEPSPVSDRPATGGRTRRRGEAGERSGCAFEFGVCAVGGWCVVRPDLGKGAAAGERTERKRAVLR